MVASNDFDLERVKRFLKRSLDALPDAYANLETNRLTLLFFILSGLDLLSALDDIDAEKRKTIIEWIYSLQIGTREALTPRNCGFRGTKSNSSANSARCHKFDTGHLAMTYTGLACLLILGDDLSRVDRLGILASVRACQLPDGSFACTPDGSENDMRFVYCACVISHMLQDWRAVSIPRLCTYIKASKNYDGAFGQGPHLESHGGSTYCAVASLHLLGSPSHDSLLTPKDVRKLLKWCLWKQQEGLHGRPEKPDDSCYSFWIGATLQLLGGVHLLDPEKAIQFTISTQDRHSGGFGKHIDALPDVMHTYLSLAGLSILGAAGLRPLDCSMNISKRAIEHLKTLQKNWLLNHHPPTPCCAES